MKPAHRLLRIVAVLIALAAGAVLVAGAASGQTTRPTTQPVNVETWTALTVLRASGVYDVPGNQAVNIVVNQPRVTLRLGPNLYPKGSRPAITVAADDCELRGTPDVLTFNNPTAPLRPNGRLGLAECIRIADDAGLTGRTVHDTRIIDVSAGRVDAYAKCFPDADGVLFDRSVSTADLKADGIFIGGSSNVTIRKGDLTARNENTIRATMDHGVLPRNVCVVDTRSINTGRKSGIDIRNVDGFQVLNCFVGATDLNSAIGIGNSDPPNPGPSHVIVQNCQIAGGALTVHRGTSIYLLNNNPRWVQTSGNSFVSLNATPGNLQDIKVIDNHPAGPYAVPQKAMIGYGDPTRGSRRENIDGYEERGNGWQPPATQPTTQPSR